MTCSISWRPSLSPWIAFNNSSINQFKICIAYAIWWCQIETHPQRLTEHRHKSWTKKGFWFIDMFQTISTKSDLIILCWLPWHSTTDIYAARDIRCHTLALYPRQCLNVCKMRMPSVFFRECSSKSWFYDSVSALQRHRNSKQTLAKYCRSAA